jgi:hypothetical protein
VAVGRDAGDAFLTERRAGIVGRISLEDQDRSISRRTNRRQCSCALWRETQFLQLSARRLMTLRRGFLQQLDRFALVLRDAFPAPVVTGEVVHAGPLAGRGGAFEPPNDLGLAAARPRENDFAGRHEEAERRIDVHVICAAWKSVIADGVDDGVAEFREHRVRCRLLARDEADVRGRRIDRDL